MQTAMWLIPILPFVLGFATTWNLKEAFEETVWFNAGYVASLGVIYFASIAGYEFVSTSPTGSGGAIALVVGFAALGVRRYRWKKERARMMAIKRAKAAEAARQARLNPTKKPEEKSLIVDAFRLAGSVQKARKQAKRSQQRPS